MAIKIPNDFNYKLIDLDPLENKVRDDLNVNIETWAKFRHSIVGGVNSFSLHSNVPITSEIKSCYVELGKSHYEVVTMLGASKISMNDTIESINQNPLKFKKSFKEFYMHAGSVLDNLARLIYIINISVAPDALDRWGKFKRHSVGYGSLKGILKDNNSRLKGYLNFINSKTINEIKTLRNNFTHSWPPTIFIDRNSGVLFWPTAMRKKEQYYLWPHDEEEAKKVKKKYKKKVPIIEMIQADWNELEKYQSIIFKRLTIDVRKFETNHNLTIY